MNHQLKTGIFILLATASVMLAETPYERELKQLKKQRDRAIATAAEPINRRYKESLDELLRKATEGNDLDTALKIKTEMITAAAGLAAVPAPANPDGTVPGDGLKAAAKERTIAGVKALRLLRKPEDMAFLKSLGLSDELRDKVYEKLTAKADLSWVHMEKMMEAARKGENYTGFVSELRQMNADLEAAMGTETYRKLKAWEGTGPARIETAEFKRYLQGRSLPLTDQKEAAVVEALHQARAGKVTFSLTSSRISMEDKLAYIDTVKQSLAPVLNAKEMALLEQHLKEVADRTKSMQILNDLPKRVEEEMKRKVPNPPAPPR